MSDIKHDVIEEAKKQIVVNGHSYDDFAERIDEPISTVQKWFSQGKFPHPLRAQKVLRYLSEDVSQTELFQSASFGDKLFLLRVREGMTIEEASSAMGISHVLLRNWEKEKQVPSDLYMRKLVRFYGIEPSDLDVELPDETFGQRLRDERTMMGYTQRALAGHIGVSLTHLSRYESDENIPGIRALRTILRLLEDDEGRLILDDDGLPFEGFETHYELLVTDKQACHQ